MMAETQARYPNQALAEGTPDMYLAEWEEMAIKYGMDTFRAGLLLAIRSSRFFPEPLDIGEQCSLLRRAEREKRESAEAQAKADAMRETWERELAEDIAAGIPRDPVSGALKESEAWLRAQAVGPTLIGWTAKELREAADALERGEQVSVPARDLYEVAAEARRRFGITREQMEAAAARVLGRAPATQEATV